MDRLRHRGLQPAWMGQPSLTFPESNQLQVSGSHDQSATNPSAQRPGLFRPDSPVAHRGWPVEVVTRLLARGNAGFNRWLVNEISTAPPVPPR